MLYGRFVTYRDRREARAARLREWADKRSAKSDAAFETAHTIADGIPMGQPILMGHHSQRRHERDAARIDGNMRKGVENARTAEAFRSKADNIERAADHAIYSDDLDATARLAARILELETARDRITAYNKACRKAGKCTSEALAILDDAQRADLDTIAKYASFQLRECGAFPAYATSNLSGNIKRLRDRLAILECKTCLEV